MFSCCIRLGLGVGGYEELTSLDWNGDKNWACLVIVLLFVVESAGSCLMREGVKGEEFVGLELSELESRHEVSTLKSLVELTELLLFCISVSST